jgi:hypothetical protein
MFRASHLYSSPDLHCKDLMLVPGTPEESRAFLRPESRIQTLSLVLESLWLFYEAMRSGKPLACGDERLAQIRAALKSSRRKN